MILATNRPEILDSAIVRDGRIDRKILVSRPGEKEAMEILKLHIAKVPMSGVGGECIEQMVETIYSSDCRIGNGVLLRDLVNGAMLANCINLAVSMALHRDIEGGAKKVSGVRMEDLLAGIEKVRTQYVGLMKGE